MRTIVIHLGNKTIKRITPTKFFRGVNKLGGKSKERPPSSEDYRQLAMDLHPDNLGIELLN